MPSAEFSIDLGPQKRVSRAGKLRVCTGCPLGFNGRMYTKVQGVRCTQKGIEICTKILGESTTTFDRGY